MQDIKMPETVITDLDIEALVDHELSTEERQRMYTVLRHDPDLLRKYDRLMTQKKLLQMWWNNEPKH